MKIKYQNSNLKKFLKRTSITLCTIAMAGTIAVSSYDIYLDSKLNDVDISKENVSIIRDYYEDLGQDPTIFVMNDSQGLNLNLGFWKNSYPKYLEEELDATVVDASSLRFNKISHMDMLLDNNLSIAEMKELNNNGAYYASKKLADDIGLPFLGGIFGTLGREIYGQKINEEDNNVCVSDLLKKSCEPIVIYSSGANDLMFLANANPNSIQKYDSKGNITDKYLYAESILCNPIISENIICNIENSFNKILSINPNSKIFVLSIYVPEELSNEDYRVFVTAINEHNRKLKKLCDKYNICFIDESNLGKIYSNKDYDFHIDEVGHKQLASILINEISKNLYKNSLDNYVEYTYDNDGLEGFYCDLVKEIDLVNLPNKNDIKKKYYLIKVYLSQLNEKIQDSEICRELIKTYK